MSSKETYPVHEEVNVIDGVTIYRTQKWWMAVLKTESFGMTKVSLYLWMKRGDRWKRRQKFTIPLERWSEIIRAVNKLLGTSGRE